MINSSSNFKEEVFVREPQDPQSSIIMGF